VPPAVVEQPLAANRQLGGRDARSYRHAAADAIEVARMDA
jgi:hypothetical protein